jgi:glycerate-2-kinase
MSRRVPCRDLPPEYHRADRPGAASRRWAISERLRRGQSAIRQRVPRWNAPVVRRATKPIERRGVGQSTHLLRTLKDRSAHRQQAGLPAYTDHLLPASLPGSAARSGHATISTMYSTRRAGRPHRGDYAIAAGGSGYVGLRRGRHGQAKPCWMAYRVAAAREEMRSLS